MRGANAERSPGPVARARDQVLRRRARAARRQHRAARRRGPRAGRRERRGQVDARQAARRSHPPRRRRDARRRRAGRLPLARPPRATPGIAVIYQEPTLFPDSRVAENVVMGRHPLGALRRIDRRAMHREVQGLLDRLGVRLDAERPVRGLSIADQQIVEIAKALQLRRARADHGRADRGAVRPGGRAPLRRRAHAAASAARRCCSSRTASRRSSRSATPSRHARRRRSCTTRRPPSSRPTRSSAGWWAATSARSSLRRRPTIGAPTLQVHRLTREGVFTDVSFEVARRRDRRAGRAGRRRTQRGGPRDLRHRPARRRARRGRRRATALGQAHGRHARRASPSCPRTAASRASSWTCRSRATRP